MYVATTWNSHANLLRERDWYRERYERERAERIQTEATLEHLSDTYELRRFAQRYSDHNAILATIIFRQYNQAEHYCLVNAGSWHGAQQDMIAVYKNMLVGRVETVYPLYSCIRCITDSSLHVPVVTLASHTKGVHRGAYSSETSYITYVSHLAQPQVEESVVTRASGLVYPYGFGVGRVDSFTQDGLHHTVYVEPYVDIRDIDYCYLVQPGAASSASAASSDRT